MSKQQRRKRLAFIIKCASLILLIFGLLGMAGVFSAGCREENHEKQVVLRPPIV